MNANPELSARLKEVMAEVLGVDPENIHDTYARGEAGRWDSLNHLRLMTALEETFGVSFTMTEIEELRRFDEIRALVGRRAG
jgi:acyl carrier protein